MYLVNYLYVMFTSTSTSKTRGKPDVDPVTRIEEKTKDAIQIIQGEADKKLNVLKVTVDELLLHRDFFEECIENYERLQKQLKYKICLSYNADGKHKRYAVHSIWRDYLSVAREDITLVTHLTTDRLHLVDLLTQHWKGPLSIALQVELKYLSSLLNKIAKFPSILQRNNIDIHIAIKTGVINFV